MNSRVEVPLFLRPRNPPVPFVGRASESLRLTSTLTRSPVAIVWGYSGVGKSALAAAVLSDRFPEMIARTLVVELGDEPGGDIDALLWRRVMQVPELAVVLRPHQAAMARGNSATPTPSVAAMPRTMSPPTSPGFTPTGVVPLPRTMSPPTTPGLASPLPRTMSPPTSPGSPSPLRDPSTRSGSDSGEASPLPRTMSPPTTPGLQSPLRSGVGAPTAPAAAVASTLSSPVPGALPTPVPVARPVLSTVEQRARALIDALEDAGLWLWIEGIERLQDAPVVRAMVELAQRYSRRMRLVLVCREDPRLPGLLGSTIPIGPMPDADLRALLQEVSFQLSTDDVVRIVADARGSPWRLLQLSAGAPPTQDASGPDASLMALSPAARGLLQTLALVPTTVPHDTLARAVRLPPPDVIDTLIRRGWVEACSRGLRLHTSARPIVDIGSDEDEIRRRAHKLLSVLVDSDVPELARAALSLVTRVKDSAALTRLLDRHGDTLRLAGHSRALWDTLRVVAPLPTGSLSTHACRLAGDLGDDAIAQLSPPSRQDGPGVLAYAELADGDDDDESTPVRKLRTQGRARAARSLFDAGTDAPMSTTHGRARERERGHLLLAEGALSAARDSFFLLHKVPRALTRLEAELGLLLVRLVQGELEGFDAACNALGLGIRERDVPERIKNLTHDVDAVFASLHARAGSSPRRAMFASGLPTLRSVDAVGQALKSAARARDAGMRVATLEAAVIACDAALVAGDVAVVQAQAQQLEHESTVLGTRRFALEARFFLRATEKSLSPTELVELAGMSSSSPVVARRAAALLGEKVSLDEGDRAVIAAVQARAPLKGQVVRQQLDGPEWTVDEAGERILLADGTPVGFSTRKVPFELLCALCRRGGAASKEQLLQDAWGVRDYHPLHHDNRLKVAVRKLRLNLEEALGADPIEATSDGYRVRGRVRFLAK